MQKKSESSSRGAFFITAQVIGVSGEFVVPLHGSIGRRSFGLFDELLQAFGMGAIFVFSLGGVFAEQ